MKLKKENLLLYAVTDSGLLKGKTLAEAVDEAAAGGAGMVQLREKGLSEEEFLKEAVLIKEVTDKYNIPLIINDNIEVCIKSDAAGVHLGQSDTDIKLARKLLGEGKIIGVSAKTPEQAIYAEKNGADYLGVGAAFSTGSKSDAKTIDHAAYNAIKNAVSIPIVAIGGINEKNISLLGGLKIDGVAVISAVFGKADIKAAAAEILELSKTYFG